MDNRNEGEFLASRRAKVTPDQAGVAAFAGQRRMPGLRRFEVAQLAAHSRQRWNDLAGRVTDEEYPAANQA